MNIDALIAAWDATLAPGQSDRSRCPKCQAEEAAFVVTKQEDGSLAWICHRASCGYKGATQPSAAGMRQNAPRLRQHAAAPEVDLYVNNEWLGLQYDIDGKALGAAGVAQDTISNGWYFPIYDNHGSKLGFNLRWYDGRVPKCRMYLTKDSESATMAWYRHPGERDWVILVEDQVSAIKIWSLGYDAVALLGTHLDPGRAGAISQEYFNCLIWLDVDAAKKAAQYAAHFRLYFDRIDWHVSSLDPKDVNTTFLKETLEIIIGKKTNSGAHGAASV